jgi:hypothetical protein
VGGENPGVNHNSSIRMRSCWTCLVPYLAGSPV